MRCEDRHLLPSGHRSYTGLTPKRSSGVMHLSIFNYIYIFIPSFETQGISMGLVFAAKTTAKDLEQASEAWKRKKIHPKLIETFQLKNVICNQTECLTEHMKPISCSINTAKEEIILKIEYFLPDENLVVLEGNPFSFPIHKGNNTLCRHQYTGPKRVVYSKST